MTLSSLSGRVDNVESSLTALNQDILTRPDLVAFEQFQTVWNQQFDQMNTLITNMQSQLRNLQSQYINLYQTVVNNYATFTGHTGVSTGVHGL